VGRCEVEAEVGDRRVEGDIHGGRVGRGIVEGNVEAGRLCLIVWSEVFGGGAVVGRGVRLGLGAARHAEGPREERHTQPGAE
jgi:hypothetical protein